MKMDTSTWKEFRVGDLFSDVITGKIEDYKVFSDGGVPILSSTMFNQGIACFADCDAMFFNRLTVAYRGAGAGYVSYHSGGFNATLNCGVMINNFELTENIGLFLASLLTSRLIEKYDYKNIITPSRMLDEIIKLPVTSSGDPDWNYMEQYMHSVMENCEKKYQTLVRISQEKHQVDTTVWGEFRVGDLFEISPTKNYGLSNTELFESDGDIPVIVNSSMNNGVGGYVGLEPTEDGNVITFSDTTDANSIFYQRYPFVGYSHVQAMRPLERDKWKEETMLFFLTCFKEQALSMHFDYANKFRRDIAVNICIKLPITPSGGPDWDYMEQYMKRIMQRQNDVVDALRKIV